LSYIDLVHVAQENMTMAHYTPAPVAPSTDADFDVDSAEAGFEGLPPFLTGVGHRIQKVREFRGMTRKELGERLGLIANSANTGVYALEVNGGGIRISTIYKLACILDVSPGFLLDGGDLVVKRTERF
jgi:DNA-binding Xre family transcriptional regulator